MAEHATFTDFSGCYTTYYNHSRRPAHLHSLIAGLLNLGFMDGFQEVREDQIKIKLPFLEMSKKRKYNEDYSSFGFTFIAERDGTQKPQCFLCGKVLANASMKPTKLKEHLTSVYPANASDSVDIFREKKARFEKAGTLPKLGFAPIQKPCFEASYKVAYRIAKQKKPHTIGETLVKPCALEMVELVCGLEQRKKIEAVLRQMMSSTPELLTSTNILNQVMEELAATPILDATG